jgi:glycerol-3-phosphate dehydrogenase
MPITEQMYQMMHFGLPPREAVRRLMERNLRGE